MNRYGSADSSLVSNPKIAQDIMTSTEIINFMSTELEDNGEMSRFPRTLLSVAAAATIMIMIVGIFGNLLTIIALIRCPKVRNVAADFIMSLCAADCLFCLLVLPFMALRYIQGGWSHGEGFLCTFVPFIQYGNVGVSLLCIGMITINRYIMIAHHSIYARVYRKSWIVAMIIFCWVFSYGFQLPTLFKVWGKFGYDPKLETCSILNDVNGRSSKTVLFITAFLIPCLIIIVCYARIFWVVHKSEQRMRRHAAAQNVVPNNQRLQMPGESQQIPKISNNTLIENNIANGNRLHLTKSTKLKDEREAKQKRNEWRITKMVLAIFLSFLACYLPITITKVLDKEVNWPGLHIFGYIMIYLSACINPIIYVIMNKQYRHAYKTVLLCTAPRLLSFGHGASSHGEKAKGFEFRYTNNHSVTMVSQVSTADTSEPCRASLRRQDSPRPNHLPVTLDNKQSSETT